MEKKKKLNKALIRAYHNVLLLEETKRKYSRTTTSFRGRNAMEFLYEEGPKKASELADFLKISRPSMTSLLVKLEELGYIVREIDKEDERSQVISLSRKGRLVTTFQTTHRNEMLEKVVSEFYDSEIVVLEKGFNRLNEVFEECADTLEATYNKKYRKRIK